MDNDNLERMTAGVERELDILYEKIIAQGIDKTVYLSCMLRHAASIVPSCDIGGYSEITNLDEYKAAIEKENDLQASDEYLEIELLSKKFFKVHESDPPLAMEIWDKYMEKYPRYLGKVFEIFGDISLGYDIEKWEDLDEDTSSIISQPMLATCFVEEYILILRDQERLEQLVKYRDDTDFLQAETYGKWRGEGRRTKLVEYWQERMSMMEHVISTIKEFGEIEQKKLYKESGINGNTLRPILFKARGLGIIQMKEDNGKRLVTAMFN